MNETNEDIIKIANLTMIFLIIFEIINLHMKISIKIPLNELNFNLILTLLLNFYFILLKYFIILNWIYYYIGILYLIVEYYSKI